MYVNLYNNPIVRAAFAGFIAALVIDLQAWRSWGDVAFNIKTASYHWLSGAISGAIVGAGYGAI